MNKSLMSYTGSITASGARKYVGDVATGYDAKRTESPKWKEEQRIIEGIIDAMPDGSQVLDCPVGTGRFISAYERNDVKWCGVDLSSDMLIEAGKKVTKDQLCGLRTGNVTDLSDFFEDDVDLAIMCRLTRWLNAEQRTQALKQLQRVSSSKIVFTARVANHPYAYPIEDIEAALEPEWKIADNIECNEPEYRIIVLERA